MVEATQTDDREALVQECATYLRPLLNFVHRRVRYHEAQGELVPGSYGQRTSSTPCFSRPSTTTASGPPA